MEELTTICIQESVLSATLPVWSQFSINGFKRETNLRKLNSSASSATYDPTNDTLRLSRNADEVEAFVRSLKIVIPETTLIKEYIGGKEVDGLLENLKAAEIDGDEEINDDPCMNC
ncbi:hypothetical protein Ddye_026887 [Dipteronia dyeriana]|uniref:Uncharacterized protein n=1 Tax=Dipteronia dyeriana TaxID=168575 RepID=A0AAD9WQU2_9ROSI|nr:hypothetical protein Ddye_026887 [Dipteronia dyeriana]